MNDKHDGERLLAAWRDADEPSVEDRKRVHAAVMSALAVSGTVAAVGTATQVAASSAGSSLAPAAVASAGAGVTTGTAAATTVAASAMSSKVLVLVAVVLAGGAGAGAVAYQAQQAATEVRRLQELESRARHLLERTEGLMGDADRIAEDLRDTGDDLQEVEDDLEQLEEEVPAVDSFRARVERRARRLRPDDVAEEVTLLGQARSALSRGDLAAAESALREHAQRFPRGALAIERRGLEALLQCERGDTSAVRRLIASAPDSPLSRRLAELCRVEE